MGSGYGGLKGIEDGVRHELARREVPGSQTNEARANVANPFNLGLLFLDLLAVGKEDKK